MSGAWPKVIAHADMDAFYASIEQLDDPALRGRAIIVGPNSSRGVVLTASYEARPFGVGSAMPMVRARRLCPQALIVPPHFERYQQVSKVIMDLFADFTPRVEALSLDEAFLDMTGSERLFGAPEKIGRRLKEAIREATGGLTASVGISATKYVAKVASGYRKPDGLTIVPPADAVAWLKPLPVEWLWGAGPKTQARLKALGLTTIGEVAERSAAELERALGQMGRRFHALAHGEDPRSVSGARAAASLSSERTLAADVSSRRELEGYVRSAAEVVARRLRGRGLRARGVRVKLKRADFRVLTRQRVLAEPTDTAAELFRTGRALLDEVADAGPFRLVGLGTYDFVRTATEREGRLALGDEPAGRARRLEEALDRLADRFGPGVVQRASTLVEDRGMGVAANLDFLDRSEEGETD